MNKPNYAGIARTHIAIVLSAWLLALSISFSVFASGAAPDDSDLQSGQKFEIVGELYALGVTDRRSRKLSFIALEQFQLRGPEFISRQTVPIGSIVTIVNKRPKKRAYFIFSYPIEYIVHVNIIDAPAGIPIVIRLGSGLEGKSTVLNPLIFKPLLDQ